MIENTQRDLEIAFMNELSAIFQRLGIDTGDVLAAAATKWNFLKFHPGLVGGHCIGVDPYYLTYRAEKAGYESQVIFAGHQINDGVGQRVARECVRLLVQRGEPPGRSVTVLGMTFKENVPDIRNSRVVDIVQRAGIASGYPCRCTIRSRSPTRSTRRIRHRAHRDAGVASGRRGDIRGRA